MPRMYPKQHEAICSPARYSVIEASTKSGKTVGCLMWVLWKAWNGGKQRNYWWVAPVYPTAIMAFNRLTMMMRSIDPDKTVWSTNKSELWLSLWNQSKIWFKSAERPDSLYGEDVYAAVIDEATRCREESWHAVRSTLTATEGPVRIIGNVKGRKNWAYKLARMAQAGDPDMSYHKLVASDAVDAGILSTKEIENARKMLPEDVFRELYLAQPSDDQGNPFGYDAICTCTVDQQSTRPPAAFGIDLARKHDWSVIVGLDEYGRVCHLERFQKDWMVTRLKIIETIRDTPALIDASGVGDPIVEDVQRSCPNAEPFVFTSPSKQKIMLGLAAAIQRRQVSFPPGWLVDELESFEYEVKLKNVAYSAPDGMHDDGVCALALAVHKLGRYGEHTSRFAFVETGGGEAYEDEHMWQ